MTLAATIARLEPAGLVSDFLATRQSDHTVRAYGGALLRLAAWRASRGADPSLTRTTPSELARYREWLRSDGEGAPHLAEGTIANNISALREFYAFATAQGQMPASPAAEIRPPRPDRAPPSDALTFRETVALLDVAYAKGATDHALVCLLVLDGLRVHEACAATVADRVRHRSSGSTLRIRGERLVLHERTAFALDASLQGRAEGPLLRRRAPRRKNRLVAFRQQDVDRLLVDLNRCQGFRELRRVYGDPSVRLNARLLRRTHVMLMIETGFPLHKVQERARHRGITTTALYERSARRSRPRTTGCPALPTTPGRFYSVDGEVTWQSP